MKWFCAVCHGRARFGRRVVFWYGATWQGVIWQARLVVLMQGEDCRVAERHGRRGLVGHCMVSCVQEGCVEVCFGRRGKIRSVREWYGEVSFGMAGKA